MQSSGRLCLILNDLTRVEKFAVIKHVSLLLKSIKFVHFYNKILAFGECAIQLFIIINSVMCKLERFWDKSLPPWTNIRTWVDPLTGVHTKGRLLALSTNNSLKKKRLKVTKQSSLLWYGINYGRQTFILHVPDVTCIW